MTSDTHFKSISAPFSITFIGCACILMLLNHSSFNHILEAICAWLVISGTFSVLIGINKTLVSIGRKPIWSITQATIDHIQRFLRFNTVPNFNPLIEQSASAGGSSIPFLAPRIPPNQGDTIDHWVEWLVSERERQNNEIKRLGGEIDKVTTQLARGLVIEPQGRVFNHKNLDQKLENVVIKGIPIQLFGVLCALLGGMIPFLRTFISH